MAETEKTQSLRERLEAEVKERFGMLPSFFRLSPENPEITASLFGFAKSAYLDNPLPSLFKERLFVYLSRFCDVRYCIIRHTGFLTGLGSPAGDAKSPVNSVEEVIRLVTRPLSRAESLESCIARLISLASPLPEIPRADSDLEEAVFACATHTFLQTPSAPKCLEALRHALGESSFQYLLVFLAFVRTAHYWTRVQTDLRLEDDAEQMLAAHEELANVLLNDPAAMASDGGQALLDELEYLREEKQRSGELLRAHQALTASQNRLLHSRSAELADRVTELERLNAEVRDSRRAALNIMEDAIQSREALRASEEKYRTLFDSIDEGYFVCDLVFDENGKPVDILYVDANPAATRMVGEVYTGRRLREIDPNFDEYWYEIFGRVALTGEATRMERYAEPNKVWYSFYVFKVGGRDSRRVAVIFEDITERKRREQQQEFLLKLSDALRHLADPIEIQAAAVRLLGERLDANQVHYGETIGDYVVIHQGYGNGLPPMVGRFRFMDFGERLVAGYRQGHTQVSRDIDHDPAITEAERNVIAGAGFHAYVAVPLIKEGKWVATLAVHSAKPRDWTASEIEIIEEAAERTWAAVERARAEEALREAHARTANILESIDDVFYALDENFVFTYANAKAEEAWGLRREEVLGRSIWDVFPQAVTSEAYELHHRVMEQREPIRYETLSPVLHRWIAVSIFPAASGGLSVYFHDIHDRKRAEETLRRSEVRFRTLADTVPQIIWTNGADGQAVYFNQRWYEYSGLSFDESVGPGWQTIVHPDDMPASVKRWQRALAMEAIFDTEYRLRRYDGVYRWFIGRNVPLKDSEGRVTGWFGTATDIDDFKQAQAARQESEERFRLLVEGARDYAMFLLDREGRITFWSAGAERIFGWHEEEIRGKSGDAIFTPEDRREGMPQREMRTALAEGRAMDRRWHQRKDGSRFWADGMLMRLDDEAGSVRGFAKITRDATEQKRGEEAVEQALNAVAEANLSLERRVQERTAELSRMSELRQELLRQLVTAQEAERARISRDLHDDTGQQITALLLGLSQLKNLPSVAQDPAAQELLPQLQDLAGEVAKKSHRLSFTLRPTALDDIGLMGALRNYAEEWSRWSRLPVEVESIGLEGNRGGRLPPEIETTIYRVAQEALTNVLRHAAPQGATRVSILVQRRGNEVLTVIDDDGPGFDPEAVLNQLPGKRRLGIFGMQERARLAGGTLEIESKPGNGASIYLRLPLP